MKHYHLTTPQQNIWNLQKYYEDTAISNLCGAIFYKEKRSSSLLQQAICQFIRNQSGIRLRFCEENEPKQYVSDEIDEAIPIMEFASMEEFDCYAEKFAKDPLGLIEQQMYRFVVFQIGSKSGILVVLSHLIADAWTFGLMANEIDAAYHNLAEDTNIPLNSADYIDYIHAEDDYLVSNRYEKDKNYWDEKYAARPEESPIKLCPIPSDSIQAKRITRALPLSLEQKIAAYCKTNPVTPAVLFETALIIYLSKINPENQTVTIGVPILNRSNAREKKIAGMFISTMPLTVTITDVITASELAKRITKGHMDLFRHQKYPYASILKTLREKQNFSGNLYDVMISYQNAKTDTGADTKWYSNGYSEVPFAIHIDNRDQHDSHTINVDYQRSVFKNEAEVEYIIERLEYVLEQIVEDSAKPIKDISIVPEEELEKLICEFNDTYVDYPREKCVHELFSEQAERTPDRTALVFEDKKFTYKQLDEISNSLAHFLREKGVKPNDVVPIIAKRSWHVIVAMLGVLKAGGAYMPVDPSYPVDRIQFILNVSKSKIGCTFGYDKQKQIDDIELIKLSAEFFENLKNDYKILIDNKNVANDMCYVIFTSGSTGDPKGVMITHHNLYNYVMTVNKTYKVKDFCMSLITNIFVDLSVTTIFLPLITGASLEVINKDYILDELEYSINKQNSMYKLTPTHVDIMCEMNLSLPANATFIIGGEALKQNNIEYICKNGRLLDEYGPTETTVGCCVKMYEKGMTNYNISIGKPIANTQIYILDKDYNPLPIGVAGELCIAGDGVGKGYLNRPELTAERFVQNPFAKEENHHGKIMYRTGDLARWRADGEIEYLGRIDTQVKIRGLRIELGEIENVMGSMEGIGLTAVADKRDENNRQYLVGYYTADIPLDEKKLRQHLSAKLPKYMVPNYFMHLSVMPMTPSGKTDRKNLPVPDFTVQAAEYVEPVTDTEKKLARIWQQLLHVEKAGKTDDFFELGGDSLLAIAMLNEIEKEFHVEITIKDIMENPLLEPLAQCIENAYTVSRITAYHEKKYVLLSQQKAIYAVYSKNPKTLTYNMPAKISLPESIDRDRLKQSISKVLDYHKLLKSYIQAEENEIYGIHDENAKIEFEEYRSGKEEKFVRPFDLGKAPLVHIGFTENDLLFDLHHIVADGESLNIILRDIVSVYEGKALKESGTAYSDYAKFFHELDTTEHKAYFHEMLKCDFEPVLLPETKNPGQGGTSKLYQIPEEIFLETKQFAKRNGLTDTMVFLGAYGILLSKYTAKKDILSSIILQNRIHADTMDMVGMFVNTLPIHIAVKENTPEYLQGIKELLLNLFRYQELPFWDIANTVGMCDKSVVNTSFVYQGDGEKTLTLNSQKLVPQYLDTHTAKFDLSMELTPLGHGCRIRMEYDCAKYEEQLMDNLAEAYIRILSQLDKEKIADISVLSEGEYHKVTEEFNDTYVDYPREKCVHELFSEQAERTPDRTALVFEDKRFTYRQLDGMSNSLAHYLRERGVKPNDVVPIIAKRSWHVIVAMLGVLKAGGAYMPVDPSYPVDRIASMMAIADSKIVLLCGYGEKLSVETIDLFEFDYAKEKSRVKNVNQPEDSAYVIFTSGSTGTPKGITICHRNVCNYLDNNNNNNVCHRIIKNQYKSIISVTNIIFDIFVTESILPLLNGLCIYFASDEEAASQGKLSRLFEKSQIDVLQTTPTKMRSYILDKSNLEYLQKIKAIILGGEAFSLDLYHELNCHTSAKIYNIYGPAETTVWSTNAEVTDADITIGKPIANTQIYILDKDYNPLPIGVAGELCIAGDGVGKGYLNRPELTAERFVPNPFARSENHHGKIMYRTGDLARWRADGEIEYLGRIDTQVKIRGLRIELGEIENVMSSMEGIGLTAVADKRDENNRQYLVGYYTADIPMDEKKLRQHLSAKLPKYMVPNYFMHLDAMPMTPSGKTDRKNLPVPDFSVQTAEYAAPQTEREKELCHLLEELLHTEKIGITDDFFEFGGDSLTAIEYVAKAHSRGIDFALQNVFDYPTVQSLCDFLEKGDPSRVRYEASDFDRYQDLFAENVIDESFKPWKKSLGNVLLTGATGFLGAHVLDQLMREESGKVYCLVRSKKTDDRRGRIREILRYYFDDKYETEFGNRIIPIVGDIEQEGLAENMPKDVQTVIHTAASVKHYGSYDYFYRVNVEGTQHVINYARSVGAKVIHISTLSVSGNTMADDFSVYRSEEEKHFYETSFYMEQPLDNVYVHSKFEAEKAVYDAMLDGLDAKVIRVGNLTNRVSDYKFQPNYMENAFLTRVKAVLEFGLFPDYLMPLYAEFSPIDLTAEGIIKIAQYGDRQCVFHLNSNRPIYFDRFLEVVHELGISMKVVESDTFNTALQQTIQDSGTEYIFEAFQNDMDEAGKLVYDSNIRIINDFTVWFLKKAGFEWNETNMEYIKGYIDYFREIGYLEV